MKKNNNQGSSQFNFFEQLPIEIIHYMFSITFFIDFRESLYLSLVSRYFLNTVKTFQWQQLSNKSQADRIKQLFWLAHRLTEKKFSSEEISFYSKNLHIYLQNIIDINQNKPVEENDLPELSLALNITVHLQPNSPYLQQWLLAEFSLKIHYPIFALGLRLFHAILKKDFLLYSTIIREINYKISNENNSIKSVEITKRLLQLTWIDIVSKVENKSRKTKEEICQSLKCKVDSTKESSDSLPFDSKKLSNSEIRQQFSLLLSNLQNPLTAIQALIQLSTFIPYLDKTQIELIIPCYWAFFHGDQEMQHAATKGLPVFIPYLNSAQIKEVFDTILDYLNGLHWSENLNRIWTVLADQLNENQSQAILTILLKQLQQPDLVKKINHCYLVLKILFNSHAQIESQQLHNTFLVLLDCVLKLSSPDQMLPLVFEAVITRLPSTQIEKLLPELLKRLQTPNLTVSQRDIFLNITIVCINLASNLGQQQIDDLLSILLIHNQQNRLDKMQEDRILADLATRFNIIHANKLSNSSSDSVSDLKEFSTELKKLLNIPFSFVEQLQSLILTNNYSENKSILIEIIELHCAFAQKDLSQLEILKNQFANAYKELKYFFDIQISTQSMLFTGLPLCFVEIREDGIDKTVPCSATWIECLEIFDHYMAIAKKSNATTPGETATTDNKNTMEFS